MFHDYPVSTICIRQFRILFDKATFVNEAPRLKRKSFHTKLEGAVKNMIQFRNSLYFFEFNNYEVADAFYHKYITLPVIVTIW